MTRRFVMIALLAIVALGGAAVTAHEDFRIIGTIDKVTGKTLAVKQTRDGEIVSMRISAKMTVTRDKKPVERTELKAGEHVVVDARGDSIKDLIAVAVRLVPPPVTR